MAGIKSLYSYGGEINSKDIFTVNIGIVPPSVGTMSILHHFISQVGKLWNSV